MSVTDQTNIRCNPASEGTIKTKDTTNWRLTENFVLKKGTNDYTKSNIQAFFKDLRHIKLYIALYAHPTRAIHHQSETLCWQTSVDAFTIPPPRPWVDPFDPQKRLTLRRRRQRWVWVYSYRVRHGVSRVRRLNDIVGGWPCTAISSSHSANIRGRLSPSSPILGLMDMAVAAGIVTLGGLFWFVFGFVLALCVAFYCWIRAFS